MKKDNIKWLDVSDLNLMDMVDEGAKLLSEAQNLLRHIDRSEGMLNDEEIKLYSLRATDMIRLAEEVKYKIASLCSKSYNEAFTKVAGCSKEQGKALRDELRKERRKGRKSNKGHPLDKMLSREIIKILDIKDGESFSKIREKTLSRLASGDDKFKKILVKTMCESFAHDHPEDASSITDIKASASSFLDEMVGEYIKTRAEA